MLGGFLGWLTVWSILATLLNFILKTIHKKFMQNRSKESFLKKIMPPLMKIFVKNHKFWGLLSLLLLALHASLQFLKWGVSLSGAAAALAILIQIGLGLYGTYLHKKRQGTWFFLHRLMSVVLLLGVFIHVGL